MHSMTGLFTRANKLVIAVGLAWATGGCQHCDKCSTLIVTMPEVDAQKTAPPVTIVMQPTGSTSLVITCSWASSVWPGGDWTCTKDSNGNTSGHGNPRFDYNDSNAGGRWTITVTGPAGTNTITRNSSVGNPGDGPPIGCSCDVYSLDFTSGDMESVGVVLGTATGGIVGVDAG
jgi:hypothetical protein